VSLALVMVLPYILPLLFGNEFKSSVILGQILIIGTMLSASRRILVEGFRGVGLPHVSSLAEISMYPWLLTGGVFLTVSYLEIGLALSVAISFSISLVVSIVYGLKAHKRLSSE